ncbi:MAG: hypothetical protein GXY52_01765 [Chloroflexi bacterium]|nr:hypothetical protein [Chloroflexota bacterium]
MTRELALIPQPKQLERGKGVFQLQPNTRIALLAPNAQADLVAAELL